jgi:hypothetical protein
VQVNCVFDTGCRGARLLVWLILNDRAQPSLIVGVRHAIDVQCVSYREGCVCISDLLQVPVLLEQRLHLQSGDLSHSARPRTRAHHRIVVLSAVRPPADTQHGLVTEAGPDLEGLALTSRLALGGVPALTMPVQQYVQRVPDVSGDEHRSPLCVLIRGHGHHQIHQYRIAGCKVLTQTVL